MMMNCREATRLMSEGQDRKLTLSENVELKFHLMMCKGCRNFSDQMGSLRSLMKEYARPADAEDPSKPGSDSGDSHSNPK